MLQRNLRKSGVLIKEFLEAWDRLARVRIRMSKCHTPFHKRFCLVKGIGNRERPKYSSKIDCEQMKKWKLKLWSYGKGRHGFVKASVFQTDENKQTHIWNKRLNIKGTWTRILGNLQSSLKTLMQLLELTNGFEYYIM